MISLHIIFSLLWTTASWYVWVKYKEKLFFRIAIIGIIATVADIWNLISERYFSLSLETLLISKKIISYIDLATIAGIVIVLILYWVNKRQNKESRNL